MSEINDLEINIMSCLLINPNLMNELIIEDKHFIKHQRMWQFMKSFYKKFKTFDVQLMYSICTDKWHIVEYMSKLANVEPTDSNFKIYQEQLIEQYEESKKDKWIKEKIYSLANDLYIGNVKVKDFKNEVDTIFVNANEIFKI